MPTSIAVRNADMLDRAGVLNALYRKNVAVMCLACARQPGGDYVNGAQANEEDYSRLTSSTEVWTRIRPGAHKDWDHMEPDVVYPLKRRAGHYSRDILVMREGRDNGFGFVDNSRQFYVDMVSVPFLSKPQLVKDDNSPDGTRFTEADANEVKKRWQQTLRILKEEKAEVIALGASGCGAFAGSANHTAEILSGLLADPDFNQAFEHIEIAIIADANQRTPTPTVELFCMKKSKIGRSQSLKREDWYRRSWERMGARRGEREGRRRRRRGRDGANNNGGLFSDVAISVRMAVFSLRGRWG